MLDIKFDANRHKCLRLESVCQLDCPGSTKYNRQLNKAYINFRRRLTISALHAEHPSDCYATDPLSAGADIAHRTTHAASSSDSLDIRAGRKEASLACEHGEDGVWVLIENA